MKIMPICGQYVYECAIFDLLRTKHSVAVDGGIRLNRHGSSMPAVCAGYVGIVGDQSTIPGVSSQDSQQPRQSQQLSATRQMEAPHVQ